MCLLIVFISMYLCTCVYNTVVVVIVVVVVCVCTCVMHTCEDPRVYVFVRACVIYYHSADISLLINTSGYIVTL